MWTKSRSKGATPRSEYLARDKLAWLLIMQTLLILPLLINLPMWLWLVWALAGFWRTQVFRGRWSAPSGPIKTLLTLLCIVGLATSYGGNAGTEAMVGLLVCAFVLKLLETNSARDAQLLIFIGFVIITSQLLFNQSPIAAAYSLGSLLLLLASWRSLYLTSQQTNRLRLKAGGRLLLHALPIMVVLFIVIPRLGPLWAIPSQQSAKTGFSDSLSPGDLGQLALSTAPAFRVEFTDRDAPPPANLLYWRGLVLDSFDGRTWRQRDSWGLPAAAEPTKQQVLEAVDYSIIMEPHGQPWLFSLMTPQHTSAVSNRRPIRITQDHLLYNPTPVTQRLRYHVSSALQLAPATQIKLTNSERADYLRLPKDANPQTRALARQWRREGLNDDAIIARALTLFNREFSYSLQPPLLGQHSVDDFLFTSKIGFCEHFASSFSVLLRAADIPVRVVVGYQGGQWNPLENYLLVSQSDAHAWAEVWIDGEGWRNIDPTAAVAPDRIQQGLSDALNAADQNLIRSQWHGTSFLFNLQQRWDAATFVWQRWVLNYDNTAQEGLLTRLLGGAEAWRITLWLIGLGLVAATLAAWALLRNQQSANLRPEIRLIKKLERKLAPLGHIREPSETLGDFIARVIRHEPQWQASLSIIARLFEQIAYRQQTQQLTQLQEKIRRFPGT